MMKKKDAVVKRDEKKCKNLQRREKQSSPQPDSREKLHKGLNSEKFSLKRKYLSTSNRDKRTV